MAFFLFSIAVSWAGHPAACKDSRSQFSGQDRAGGCVESQHSREDLEEEERLRLSLLPTIPSGIILVPFLWAG